MRRSLKLDLSPLMHDNGNVPVVRFSSEALTRPPERPANEAMEKCVSRVGCGSICVECVAI